MPFCVSKCRYCDFNSYALTDQDLERHVDAVLQEARARITKLNPQTVFFGGGTPSLLPAGLLHRFLTELDSICGFQSSSLETTMEANPESFDGATSQAAFEGGVNRVSIGIQSLRPEVLQAYDRVHSPETALGAFEIARNAGFQRINLDLIYAFPGQSERKWLNDLATIHTLGAEHLSCYELSYEPGTALTRLKDAGRWQAASEETCAAMFEITREANEAAGYEAYEVSAFAKAGEASMHNLSYWRSLNYVGIGAGAAGWHQGVRRRNLERPEQYEAAVQRGKDPVAESEQLNPATVLFDHLMMGLRLPYEGVLIPRAQHLSGLDLRKVYANELRELLDRKLLEIIPSVQGDRLRTTHGGLMILDDILTRFLPEGPSMSV
ncbi:MAG: radical SAM family heme chaperone HemW [Planctomycetes bacterium]|nr:radical SAM family heme chaperone HemW [Planctomycetota bacterium]MCP4771113.1 radical SAM family heme chaperone HemW [Planctomycetota bacterium]